MNFCQWQLTFLASIVFVLISCHGHAAQTSKLPGIQLVNERMFLYHDTEEQLHANQAYAAFQSNKFQSNENKQVSFGFTDSVIWSVLPIVNPTDSVSSQIIKIDNAWLDEVDVYFFKDNKLIRRVPLGDSLPFTQRPRNERMPSVEHSYKAGTTYVLFRFRSEDPMTIPIYLSDEQATISANIQNAYFYGALYGSLLILFIYNFVLCFYLKERKYLLYSIYLLSFTAFNFTYTGHGFWLLWPDYVTLQQWLMPTLMFCYLFSGVMFAIEFLNTRVFLPSLHAARYKIYIGLLLLGCVIVLLDSRALAVMLQLIILTTVTIWMLIIGYYSYKAGNPLAKFFIPAIAMGTSGATVSSLATWGIIPYSQWAFRGIEIGMLLEMSLLSISLGFNVKLVQDARKNAENNARLDPLTNLYNRRAFADLVHPIWELGKRNKTPMSILLIDLDWFKRINDKFGHATGDHVLERVAIELKNRLRDSDITLRWGGEEFLVFLPNTDSDEAKNLAEKLRASVESMQVNKVGQITMSVGVACTTPDKMSTEKLISNADQALYLAKSQGRNKVAETSEV